MKLYLDPGHGGKDPGSSGNGIVERNITLDIALHIRSILNNNYENVQIKMSRTDDQTKTLQQRTNEANSWGADFYLSIHCNSFNGSARGYEDYIHSSLPSSTKTAKYQDIIHAEITKVNNLQNRGKKKANYHVLRESVMPALLTENGFIDQVDDAKLMKDPSWRKRVAQGHVNGLAKAFNLKRKQKQQDNSKTFYRVIAGSFQSKENATEQVKFLANKGIDAFIGQVTISGKQWFRVQAGAFNNRENAEKLVQKLKKLGSEATIIK